MMKIFQSDICHIQNIILSYTFTTNAVTSFCIMYIMFYTYFSLMAAARMFLGYTGR